MALILRYLDDMHTIMNKHGDPRTNDWFLMSSPFPTLAICLSYVYLVKVLGPRLMENRKPFELKNTLIVYNLFQVIFSTWLFYEYTIVILYAIGIIGIIDVSRIRSFTNERTNRRILIYKNCLMGGWLWEYSYTCQPVDRSHSPTAIRLCMSGWVTGRYSLRCQPVDYSNHPETIRMVHVCWWYYFSKFTEFMDTIFFVLRKKNNHVSSLHVIHHGCMPMSVWFGVKFTPGGHSTFFGLLNTFVHIIMYSYYLLAAFGPRFQKYLWWKKYLTALQMLQFVAIMLHAFQLLFIDCNYPRAFVWWIGMHAVMFFFLFKEFYKQAYDKKEKRRRSEEMMKEKANGAIHENGKSYSNGVANGVPNGSGLQSMQNGISHGSKASDYYLTTNDLHMRKSHTAGN